MFHNTSNDEITKYLAFMKRCLKDGNSKLIIKEDRDKNYVFKYLYSIRRENILDILLSLEVGDFHEKLESENPNHLGEELYVFTPTREFTAQDGNIHSVRLYIKTYVDKGDNRVVVISFHKFGEY